MRREDISQPPCSCPDCRQAGVSDRPVVRDPHSGKLLHGQELRRYYEAADGFLARFKVLVNEKSL